MTTRLAYLVDATLTYLQKPSGAALNTLINSGIADGVTVGKTLTLAAADDYTLTAEASGAVIVRTAVPNIVGLPLVGNARGQYAVELVAKDPTVATMVASGESSTIIGGQESTASGDGSTIVGGNTHIASASSATVIGGQGHTASAQYATIVGGISGTASGVSSLLMASETSTASGDYSAGYGPEISATHAGAKLFSDQPIEEVFSSIVASEFAVRAQGGFRLAYDNAHYYTAAVSAAGVTTFATLPVGAGFVFTPAITLTSTTASTLIYSDAARAVVSLANAAGYLYNNGAGALSYVAAGTGFVGNGTAQYQVLTTGANPYPAAWSDFYFRGTAGGTLVAAVTNTKTLTLTATDSYNLTISATGTAAIATGIAGGQTIYGGTAANDDLTLEGTSHATKTTSYVILQPTTGNVGIGSTAPGVKLQVVADGVWSANTTNSGAQLRLHGLTDTNKRLGLGFDTTNNLGYIQASITGDNYYPLLLNPGGGNIGIGLATAPGSRFHIVSSTATTSALVSIVRIEARVTGVGVGDAGLGPTFDFYAESSVDTTYRQQARLASLWTDATDASRTALFVGNTTGNAVNTGYFGHWNYSAVAGAAITVIPNATGDVTEVLTCLYAVSAVTGGDAAGGTCVLEPSDSFNLYSDGTDTLTLTVAADGSVTVQRTAGADTWKVSLWMTWI